MLIERVGPEEEAELKLLAQQLHNELTFVGLEAKQAGDYFTGDANLQRGLVVFYDPSAEDRESAGLFVRWTPSSQLLAEARDSNAPDSTSVIVGGAAMDAMTEALERILEALGWWVETRKVGVHESCLKVGRAIIGRTADDS